MKAWNELYIRYQWIFTNLGLVIISGLAGLSGYLFNLLISNIWGPLALGQVLGVLGGANFIALPASLIILPIAKWSIQNKAWRERLLVYQLYALAVGIAIVSILILLKPLWDKWLTVPEEWLMPLFLWIAPSFLFAFYTGLFLGRRAYWLMGIVGGIPQIGKPVLLALGFFSESFMQDPLTSLWIVAISQWLGIIMGMVGIYSLEQSQINFELPNSLWASGWVSVITHAWITWDSAVAYIILSTSGLSVYGVVATLGKTPFFLANHVANIGISEKGWGENKKRLTQMMIIGVGIAVVLVFIILGPFLLNLFGLTNGLLPLLAYTAANTILALIYFNIGADAQDGRHTWYPLGILLAVWTIWILFTKPNELGFILSIGGILLVSLFATWLLAKFTKRTSF